jgi:microcompartment protein CcmK/EutM
MRRASRARALVALGAVALFALLAFAALLLVGAIADRGAAIPHDTHATAGTSVGAGSEHDVPAARGPHQQPATRSRNTVVVVVAVVAVVAAVLVLWIHRTRAGQPRVLRITGLPPGRAPPLAIA